MNENFNWNISADLPTLDPKMSLNNITEVLISLIRSENLETPIKFQLSLYLYSLWDLDRVEITNIDDVSDGYNKFKNQFGVDW